jgi:hypothetical protein
MRIPENGTLKWIIGISSIPMATALFSAGVMWAQVDSLKTELEGDPRLKERVIINEEKLKVLENNQKEIKSDVKDILNILIKRFGPPPEDD